MKPVVILIRDGWGYRKSKKDNAIAKAKTPFTDELMKKYPNTLIKTSGKAVGLPNGYQGNSEVGHITIGSGRIIKESMVQINEALKNFNTNYAFKEAILNAKTNNSTLHLIGLLQTEGVHAHSKHLYALIELCKKNKINFVVHVITDGRDAPPTAAEKKIKTLQRKIGDKIATISGRYFAMDRDKRWKRTHKAYRCIVDGKADEITPLKKLYRKKETDEFLIPRRAKWYEGMNDNDSVIFYNFRTDRTRQLTQAIVEKKFSGFGRKRKKLVFVAMTEFYKPMKAIVAFEQKRIENILGQVLSDNKKKQLRISETEKYPHVTFFFNAENEVPYKGEKRILVNSPKVATYDLKPEMSAKQITSKVITEMHKFDVVVMNIVNGDMVGHTGVVKACLKAVEVVDECVKKIVNRVLKLDGTALVFADHGNVEDQTPKWRTSHTTNPVPFIVVSNKEYKIRKSGGLQDIAPTVLKLLDISQPVEMTGRSMII